MPASGSNFAPGNDNDRNEMKRATLLIIYSLLFAIHSSAQTRNDSTEMDSYDRYHIGGYGEMVTAFKDYGLNRFNGHGR